MIEYLKQLSYQGKKIYIWGCGNAGQKVYEALTISGIVIQGFFDNKYPYGTEIDGKHICSQDALEENKDDIYIIIAAFYRLEIQEQLERLGIKNVFDQRDLGRKYRDVYPEIQFKEVDNPLVSVLMTAYNEWDYTYNSLESLMGHHNNIEYEVILGDDLSTDETANAEKYLKNVTVIHHKYRHNYLGNVNAIAQCAKGEYIILLANDTIVLKNNWIDIMVEIMKQNPDVGMISGKYWTPVYGRYETAFNYGDNWEELRLEQDADKQEVDFVWPIATMIRKEVWDKIGGFSTEYLPAFCEDNDLCMKVISEGYKCLYVPQIETIHFSSASYCKAVNVKELIDSHIEIFKMKWKGYLNTKK